MISESNDCNRDDSRRRLFDDRGEVPMPKDVTLSIDDVSKAFRISKLRLWYYERLGLIKRRNRFGLGFVYQWDDCARLFFIIKARNVGLSAFRLAPLIRAANPGATTKSIERARSRCLDLIDRLDLRRRTLRAALAEFRLFYELLAQKLPGDKGGDGPHAP